MIEWTQIKPTQPGTYVYRQNVDVQGVTVGIHMRALGKELYRCVRNLGPSTIELRQDWSPGWWYGPLPE